MHLDNIDNMNQDDDTEGDSVPEQDDVELNICNLYEFEYQDY